MSKREKELRAELAAKTAECERLKESLAKFQLSEFNPDWSLLQASQDSLRENMAMLKDVIAERDKLLAERKALDAQEPIARTCSDDPCINCFSGQGKCSGPYRPVPAMLEGWQLVPKAPTPEMVKAAAVYEENSPHEYPFETSHYGRYKAMLAAAPKAPE